MATKSITNDRKNDAAEAPHHLERYPSMSQGTMIENDMDPPKTYKRRFVAMLQLFVLNLCFTIAWIDLAPVVDFAAEHFQSSVPAINWFSTSFFFAAVIAQYPASFVARRGLKLSMLASGAFMVGGTWLMYGGTRIKSFGMAMIGHCVIGMGQPFSLILAAPFSDAWFHSGSRATATAVSGLATILGSTIGQFIIAAWVKSKDDVTSGILYQSILLSTVCFTIPFIPAKPPTPTARNVAHQTPLSHTEEVKMLLSRSEVYFAGIPFALTSGVFNAMSFLLFQICMPYGFTIDQCVVAGLLLIVPGLVVSLLAGRLADMFRCHLALLKGLALLNGAALVAFIWVAPSRNIGFLNSVSTILSIGVIAPSGVAIEFITEIIYPLKPELALAAMWGTGQLLGAVFTIGCGYMNDANGGLQPGVYLMVALGLVAVPLTWSLGLWGRREFVQLRRTAVQGHL
ncbi:major facilitator superfamily domain protein [Fusarium sp. NRRL 25303]|nr:major facilitator superfamily domain protein [Fusarium sp. NRRL 25303]